MTVLKLTDAESKDPIYLVAEHVRKFKREKYRDVVGTMIWVGAGIFDAHVVETPDELVLMLAPAGSAVPK